MATSENGISLWTIQHSAAWESAQEAGVLKGDARHVDESWRPPYRWMIEQMRERLPRYDGAYPIWAYVQNKPDLRKRHFSRGTPGVRIAFVASPEDILISSFTAWHTVLAGHYCALSEEDANSFDADNDILSVWAENDQDPERTAAIMKSWERIFDVETLAATPDWWGDSLQATVGSVMLDQIIEATPFTSK